MTPLGQQTAGKDLKVRYLYLGGAMLFGLLVLAVQLYRLQVTRGDEFSAKSVENFVKEVRIPADRGLILDSKRQILVDSRPSFDVFITPAFCLKCTSEVLPRLAQWLGWDEAEREEVEKIVAKARREAQFRPVAIRIDVPRETADFLDARRVELPGVDVQATPHRHYRTGEVMSHVIGYMNEVTLPEMERLNSAGANYQLGDYIGRRGIEKAFESSLRGRDGHRKRVVDARGEPIAGLSDLVGGGEVVEPGAGNNVILSIDMRLQEEADRAFPGQAGAVVVVDVRTGFVRALLSKPGYDPNLFTGRITGQQMAEMSKDPFKPLMNRVTQMRYSPGSTFKVVTALAALREKAYNEHTHVFCPGGYRLGSRVWRCDKESGHGSLDIPHAVQQSCNVFFWRAADLMGIEPIAREARELGLGAPTGITALMEDPGIIPDTAYHDRVTPGGYQKGMALNSAIGQGDVNVTPIQLAMMYATIANGGKLFRPQLVERIESPDGQVLKTFDPELVRQVEMSPEARALVVKGLEMVVNEAGGTAYWRRPKNIFVAGKTGTAQVVRLGDRRIAAEKLDYWVRDHAWFAAFAPADNPEIAVVVLNEHGGFGASGAAPVAMQLIEKYFALKAEDAAVAQGHPPTPALAGAAEGEPVRLEPKPVQVSPATVNAVLDAAHPAPLPAPAATPKPDAPKPDAPSAEAVAEPAPLAPQEPTPAVTSPEKAADPVVAEPLEEKPAVPESAEPAKPVGAGEAP